MVVGRHMLSHESSKLVQAFKLLARIIKEKEGGNVKGKKNYESVYKLYIFHPCREVTDDAIFTKFDTLLISLT